MSSGARPDRARRPAALGEIGFEAAVDQPVDETGFERPAPWPRKRYTSTPPTSSYLYGAAHDRGPAAGRGAREGPTSTSSGSTTPSCTAGPCPSPTPGASSTIEGTGCAPAGGVAGLAAAGPARHRCAIAGGPGGPRPRAGVPDAAPTATEAEAILAGVTTATVDTTLGVFIMTQTQAAPIATANFVALARCGFYEEVTFHRVLAGFVAQAGTRTLVRTRTISRAGHRRTRLLVRDRSPARWAELRPLHRGHGELGQAGQQRQPVLHLPNRSRQPAAPRVHDLRDGQRGPRWSMPSARWR